MIMLLSINRGKIHEYLGITIDLTNKGETIITVYGHIGNIIEETSDIYKTGIGKITPAPHNMYRVRDPQDGN